MAGITLVVLHSNYISLLKHPNEVNRKVMHIIGFEANATKQCLKCLFYQNVVKYLCNKNLILQFYSSLSYYFAQGGRGLGLFRIWFFASWGVVLQPFCSVSGDFALSKNSSGSVGGGGGGGMLTAVTD